MKFLCFLLFMIFIAPPIIAVSEENYLLILIDTSGSMHGRKLAEVKMGALDTSKRAIDKGSYVSIYAFAGSCDAPIANTLSFTRSMNEIKEFVNSLEANGGTPLADALIISNQYMDSSTDNDYKDNLIIVLADGDNDCGSVEDAIKQIKSTVKMVKHQTIGVDIGGNSNAVSDLKSISSQSGGTYYSADNASDIQQAFKNAHLSEGMSKIFDDFIGAGNNSPKATVQTSQDHKPKEHQTPVEKAFEELRKSIEESKNSTIFTIKGRAVEPAECLEIVKEWRDASCLGTSTNPGAPKDVNLRIKNKCSQKVGAKVCWGFEKAKGYMTNPSNGNIKAGADRRFYACAVAINKQLDEEATVDEIIGYAPKLSMSKIPKCEINGK